MNPESKNTLYSNVEVRSDTKKKLHLFNDWLESNNQDINIWLTINWLIYDITNGSISSNVSIIWHNEESFINYNDNNDDNDTLAIYLIDSYYVFVYSDVSSSSKYSGVSICNVFDDFYLKSGHTYQFMNTNKFLCIYFDVTYTCS